MPYHKKRTNTAADISFVVALLVVALGYEIHAHGISYGDKLLITAAVILVLGIMGIGIITRLRQRRALHKLKLSQIDTLDGISFERWVGEQMRRRGYHIRYTPQNDYGVDIIATKQGIKTAVQVKRHKSRLDQKPVREAVAGMVVYHCSASMVVTNSYFTEAARTLARLNNCTLIDRPKLAAWL